MATAKLPEGTLDDVGVLQVFWHVLSCLPWKSMEFPQEHRERMLLYVFFKYYCSCFEFLENATIHAVKSPMDDLWWFGVHCKPDCITILQRMTYHRVLDLRQVSHFHDGPCRLMARRSPPMEVLMTTIRRYDISLDSLSSAVRDGESLTKYQDVYQVYLIFIIVHTIVIQYIH